MTGRRTFLLLLAVCAAALAWRAGFLTGRRATGTLIARESMFTLRLESAHGPLTAEGRRGRATLASGPYLLTDWSARMQDDRGRTWELRRSQDVPSRMLRVPAGGTAPLRLAAPVEPDLAIDQSASQVVFRLRLRGAGGENCGQARVNGRSQPPPRLRIEDARGRVISRLTFESTCGAVCAQVWRPPTGLSQPLRAIPELDLGPFAAPPAAFRFTLQFR